jgi:ribosomal protein S18 acetylase RimI-like enzyme
VNWLRGFLVGRPLFSLYLNAAFQDLCRGLDNRVAHVGRDRLGAVLGIRFDGLAVFTAIGSLRADELCHVVEDPCATELHIEGAHEQVVTLAAGARLIAARDLQVRGRSTEGATPDAGARRLCWADRVTARSFMTAHNARTVFSDWMLALPFVAIEEGGSVVATAGTIARADRRALIGNFLTHPERRCEGLARRLALHLAWLLRTEGVEEVYLVTTADNTPALRAYDAAEYRLIEKRRQLDLAPTSATRNEPGLGGSGGAVQGGGHSAQE